MKTKISITVDRETVNQLVEQVVSGKFRNKSHLIEFAVKRLLEEENGGE